MPGATFVASCSVPSEAPVAPEDLEASLLAAAQLLCRADSSGGALADELLKQAPLGPTRETGDPLGKGGF